MLEGKDGWANAGRCLASGVTLLMAGLVLAWLFAGAYPWLYPSGSVPGAEGVRLSELLGWPQLVLLALALPTLLVQLYGLRQLRYTFLSAARGHWFASPAVDGFRRFAWASLLVVPLEVARASATGLYVQTLAGDRTLSLAISVGSQELRALVTALLFVFVAQTFSAGHALDEDVRTIL
jgi:hypothetical protein